MESTIFRVGELLLDPWKFIQTYPDYNVINDSLFIFLMKMVERLVKLAIGKTNETLMPQGYSRNQTNDDHQQQMTAIERSVD